MKSRPTDRLGMTLLCLILLFVSVACGDRGGEREVQDVDESSAADVISATGPVGLALVPDEPTVKSDIKAVVSGEVGSKEISFRWRVEGKEVAGVGGDTLESSNFTRGQSVAVTSIVGSEVLTARTSVVNSAPEVQSISLSPDGIYAGVDVTVEVVGYDADGDDIGYNSTWFVNGNEQVTVLSNRLEGLQFARGDEISVEVVPYDAEGDGELYAPLPVTVPNGPPSFVSLPSLSFTAEMYTYQAEAIDPDGDELTYSLNAGPDGMSISQDGLVTWKIGRTGVGTHEVELIATDSEGAEAFQRYELAIEIR